MTALRIDKWLWAVRLFRTRSMAIEACRAGHVKAGGESVKPAHAVRVGEVIAIRLGAMVRTVRVRGLIEKRVGAGLVSECLEDLTPPEEYAKRREAGALPGGTRPRGSGRPTKRERRILEQFMGD